ncbi:MAG: hypothetical protein AAGD35_09000 [Actinomycetota bacterium]
MSEKRQRLDRAAQHADDTAQRARAELARASREVDANAEARQDLIDRSTALAGDDMSSQLRSHLAGAGARRLTQLVEEKAALQETEARTRVEAEAANARLKALERLVKRVDDADALRRRRAADAELQDLVASRATREER